MKIKSFIKINLVLALFIMANACTDKFLEVDQRGLISQDDFYKTDKDALSAVVASYDILQSMYAQDWNSCWMLKTLPGDEINCGGGNSSDQPNYQELALFKHTPSNVPVSFVYQSCYQGIYRANKVIEKVAADTDAKKVVIGEAKCLRAFYYFELVTLYGEVPLVLRELAPDEYAQAPAQPQEIWAQIEKDLNEAITALPVRSKMIADYGAQFVFRVNKGTAQALLGKALLYQKKFADAAIQFNNVIVSKEFELDPDYSRILRIPTEYGKESLLEISYSTEEGHTWANSTFPWGNGRRQENMIHWQLCGPRGDGYFDGGTSGLISGWGFAYPTQIMWDAYTSDDTIRRNSSLMSENQLKALGGKIRNSSDELPYGCQGFVRLKYGTWADETNIATQPELNYGTNIRLIRYADILLMAAEAYNKSNNDPQALIELNKVRARAKMPAVTATGTALFDAIVHERQVELAFEGHRFLDLVRWGKAVEVLGSKGYTPKFALFPIPESELMINSKMTQNSLWR